MQGMTLEEVAEATEAASKQYNVKRVPSYCDRILFTSLPSAHKALTQIAYDSAAEITSRCVCVRSQFNSFFRLPSGKYRRLKGGLCPESCDLGRRSRRSDAHAQQCPPR